MIATINGKVFHIDSDYLVISIGGVGLQVYTTSDVCARLQPGDAIFLHTHLVVREDSLTLFGFETQEMRDVFLLLLGVSGIGPRLSLNILSILSPDSIRRAVFNEQAEVFARVPGVGRKTAQKVLLHLQDRIKPGLADFGSAGRITEVDSEVLAALTALGYSVVEAQSAIQNIPREATQDIEERIRLALQYFSR